MMRNFMKKVKFRKNERGQVLIWVLLLLILGSIVLGPLLQLMNTHLISSHVYENMMQRFYAADAGIEDAAYKIGTDDPNLPTSGTYNYTITDVNGYQVNVTIEDLWLLEGIESWKDHGAVPHWTLAMVGQIITQRTTRLSGNIAAGDDTIPVETTAGFPEQGMICIDNELITYTGKTDTQFTGCTRGAGGTEAAPHSDGKIVYGQGTIQIEISWAGTGELKIERIGVWLPAGFSYVNGSSSITTTLAQDISSGDTQIQVNSTELFPSEGVLSIEDELIYYTSTIPTKFKGCNRGYAGTTAVPHDMGTPVGHEPAIIIGDGGEEYPDINSTRGGTVLIWAFPNIDFEKLPTLPPPGGAGEWVISTSLPVKRGISFQYTPSPAGQPTGSFSWMRTNRQDVILSWDADSASYKVTSTAQEPGGGPQTTLESYIAKSRSPVYGDYRAIGQSLMIDTDGDKDGIRDRVLNGSDAPTASVGTRDDASVEMAYLYWSAWRANPEDINGYSDNQLAALADEVDRAEFWRTPEGESAVGSWVTANRTQILPNYDSKGKPHGWSYSCFADVTSLIIGNGNGSYQVREIDGITPDDDLGDQWSYAGWSLVIIYSSPSEDAHQLYLYDEFLYADEKSCNSFSIVGFEVPKLRPEDEGGRLTIFVGEGDDVWNGDYIEFNPPCSSPDGKNDCDEKEGYNDPDHLLPLTGDPYQGDPPVNPQNDVWNGMSSGLGGESIDGVDIDTFALTTPDEDVTNVIAPGDTWAEVELGTGDDSWNLVYIILSIRTQRAMSVSFSTYTFQ